MNTTETICISIVAIIAIICMTGYALEALKYKNNRKDK